MAIIVPTFREKENLAAVVDCLRKIFTDRDYEVIFVDDDSDDGSYDELIRLITVNPDVRFIRRIGRRGLSSACIEGLCATGADLLAVMDADLQHDEKILPEMVKILENNADVDIVIGTRYAGDGGTGQWSKRRQAVSQFATKLEKLLLKTSVSDPMSGFFVIRRNVFEAAVRRVSGRGFKILLDLLLSSPRPLRVREVAYTFRTRQRGDSKLDLNVCLEFLVLLLEKMFGRVVPVRFFLYCLVGLSGLALHLGILAILHEAADWAFAPAQLTATISAMISNFIINNHVTYSASRLKGRALIPGSLLYITICAIGAVANVQLASYLFESGVPWWLSGSVGAGIGAVWNFSVSTQIVWTWFPQRSR